MLEALQVVAVVVLVSVLALAMIGFVVRVWEAAEGQEAGDGK